MFPAKAVVVLANRSKKSVAPLRILGNIRTLQKSHERENQDNKQKLFFWGGGISFF